MTPTYVVALALTPVLLHALAAAAAEHGHRDRAWRAAEFAALGAALSAAAAIVLVLLQGPQVAAGLRLDAAGTLVGLLVGFIGWVIVRFSHRYLQGEEGERRYLRLLSGTLAAVSLVLVADQLLLLWAAWAATSMTLHRLLRFYEARPAARLAAHKKFLSARLADAALLGAVVLLGLSFDTFSLQAMLQQSIAFNMSVISQVGLSLLVLTALLKCAQMPLHGWLLQVMEAPTPVSALLHAGVVNLGGLVLIRFAPLLVESPVALGLLAGVATLTVVLATLVLGTRISVKVALAWSTLAQMGFMLLQVALGLPAMALLHLVAHSLYKAHAFLAAGGAVQRRQVMRLATPSQASLPRWAAAAIVLPATAIALGSASGLLVTPSAWLAAGVLGLALVPLAAAGRLGATALVMLGWFAGHAAAASWLGSHALAVPTALPALVAMALAGLFAVQAAIVLQPGGSWVRRLYPWAYGGFYVDERISGALLRLWPAPPVSLASGAR
ncbi:NADH-quinone oxidoreductase subunit L [Aquabacterium sp.]|uniref:NADH-quinone oxidoreductase subunit L n=1 Tax=Aquabacterium sp. TaxID=1872578 RepID=UPI003784F630